MLAVLLVLTTVGGVWLLQDKPHAASPGPADPAPPPPSTAQSSVDRCAIVWFTAPDLTKVPRSACHGPRYTNAGRAKGFSHDEQGAVFAAINLSMRLSAAAGPAVFNPTFAEQTVGDSRAAVAELAGESTTARPAEVRPTQWWSRVSAGDPAGDLVEIELLAATAQATASGQYAQLTVVLRWNSGDWKVQLPRRRAHAASSTTGFASLGAIPGAVS
ncbi:hypothetical protein ACIRG5_45460 [Lentzea sp. NPDC102401]|uniref:hypothetical protein n=1 Tax=Lentzea sp. NPDC102401 TaxID=3364128 RepID=UPI0037FF6AB9